jgi:hypothetical protein
VAAGGGAGVSKEVPPSLAGGFDDLVVGLEHAIGKMR